MRRLIARLLRSGAAAGMLATLAVSSNPAQAQDYPQHPIRLVVPWPAGGNTDAVSRELAARLGVQLGGSIIVENRGGANGQIGAATVARAAADGYTLLVASAETHSIVGEVRGLSYDPLKDFAPIGTFGLNPFMLVGRSSLPFTTTAGLVEHMRANPGKLTYGSWGIGSTGQIAMEMFKSAAGISALHVPFQGSAPAETALLGGQIDLMIMPVGRAAVLRKSGKITIFAAMTAKRTPLMPDIPTLAEMGYHDVNAANWFGIMAPANTPAPIVDRLASSLTTVLDSPQTREAFGRLGIETLSMPRKDFLDFERQALARWTKAVASGNVDLRQ